MNTSLLHIMWATIWDTEGNVKAHREQTFLFMLCLYQNLWHSVAHYQAGMLRIISIININREKLYCGWLENPLYMRTHNIIPCKRFVTKWTCKTFLKRLMLVFTEKTLTLPLLWVSNLYHKLHRKQSLFESYHPKWPYPCLHNLRQENCEYIWSGEAHWEHSWHKISV